MVLGLVNVHGELLVCVSLRRILGLESPGAPGDRPGSDERLLVIERDGRRTVCPVDEVHGIQRFHPRELKEVPATIARASTTYTKAVLPWQKKSVGLLDDALLFHSIDRRLASATAT